MKIAVIGSRNIVVKDSELEEYLYEADEIVSGGAVGVDKCAAHYAQSKNIRLTEFLPNYEVYGRAAPIVRNHEIVDYADKVVAFWDGSSRGTHSVIKYAQKRGKKCEVIIKEQI